MGAPPKFITKPITKFCNTVNSNSTPQFIPIRPIKGAIHNDCFPNVEIAVKNKGGKAVNGWAIWEWQGVFIEAEFHSV